MTSFTMRLPSGQSLMRLTQLENKPRQPGDPAPVIERDAAADSALAERQPVRYLLCRRCRRPIARPEDAIEVNASHGHFCTNPYGYSFRIGCFADACGLIIDAAANDAHSWFPGYHWQLAYCVDCHVHLGWFYRGAGDSFYGLILDRLIELSQPLH